MNILVLSCGTRNKVMQYFRKTLKGKGKLFATDCSRLAPALYEADNYFIVPRMTDDGYLGVILDICKKNRIDAVFSLIDPELSVLAKNRERFLDIGTTPVVSDYDVVEMCFDKVQTMNKLEQLDFNVIKTYTNKDIFYNDVNNGIIQYPVFVKPRRGSASININKVYNKETIEALYSISEDLIVQEYMNGTEYGVDAYIDMISGKTVSVFIKEKLKMRAGETDKAVSVHNKELTDLVLDFTSKVKFRGMIDLDIFKVGDKYYISEINPRFGGGYPHAYECGVNEAQMLINNIAGHENNIAFEKYKEGIYMMKYNEVMIK